MEVLLFLTYAPQRPEDTPVIRFALPYSCVRFGEELELDRSAYQLRRSGRAVRLERIPLEILMLLAERPGQLVTREEIAERIWGKDANLDLDNSINGAVRKIRQALKDDPEQPRFVQTVTGRGYRFVAPVLGPTETAAGASPAPPPEPAPPRRSRVKVWLASALLVPLLVAALVWSRDRDPDPPRGPRHAGGPAVPESDRR